jgi:hypothetical protein
MLDAATNTRIRELTELIAKERDSEKFTEWVAELNKLLDGPEAQKPTCTPSVELVTTKNPDRGKRKKVGARLRKDAVRMSDLEQVSTTADHVAIYRKLTRQSGNRKERTLFQ